MNIKKQDKVLIISGKDKGKIAPVIKAIPRDGKIVVEKANISKKHVKPRYEGQKGEIIEKPMPIDVSNVKLVCPKCSKPTRIGKKALESGKRIRVCKKCGEEIT